MSADAGVATIKAYFESLTPQSLERLGDLYTTDAYFKDPFNEVRGLPAVRKVFDHMFAALEQPRFVITGQVVQGDQCFLCWDFKFHFKGGRPAGEQTVRGTSHLKLAADGRVSYHRDYWDVAEELYEKLPLLGGFMRWLKRRAGGG